MKNIKWLGLIIILLVSIFLIAKGGSTSGNQLLNAEATTYSYALTKGVSTDHGFIEISYNDNSNKEWYLNVFNNSNISDSNEDPQTDPQPELITLENGDQIEVTANQFNNDSSWPIQNVPVKITKDQTQRFSFNKYNQNEYTALTASLTSKKIDAPQDDLQTKELKVEAKQILLTDQFGYNVPGAREGLKRGVGNITYAQIDAISGSDFWLDREADAIPDLTGGPMDCFAISTTNNLISLIKQNNSNIELPEPQAMIEELKKDMQWDDGIINANFLTGKAAFVERYNLPVTTTEIKRPTVDDFEAALESGGAIEISTTMLRSKSGRANTGHVITGVGGFRDGSEAGLAAHDPATPEGVDTFEIAQTGGDKPYLMINYGMWDGITIIDAIYIQTWNEASDTIEDSKISLEDQEELLIGDNVKLGEAPLIEMAYDHTSPGQYSEIFVSVTTSPNHEVTVKLNGPAIEPPSKQVLTSDKDGVAHFTYRIYQYGAYNADINIEGVEETYNKSVNVQ